MGKRGKENGALPGNICWVFVPSRPFPPAVLHLQKVTDFFCCPHVQSRCWSRRRQTHSSCTYACRVDCPSYRPNLPPGRSSLVDEDSGGSHSFRVRCLSRFGLYLQHRESGCRVVQIAFSEKSKIAFSSTWS